jgi:glyoxylate reductase
VVSGDRPQVAVTSPLPGRAEAMLGARFAVRVHGKARLLDQASLAAFVDNAVGLLTLLENPVGEELLAACPRLRVVANCAVGYDNVDLEAARRHRVWVTNTPDVLTEATADLAWALILAATRRVVEGDRFLREGRFHGWRLDLLLGAGLQGETLGVVGYGRIGRAVARRGLAFGMRVVFAEPAPVPSPDPPAEQLPLDELLAVSRVVTLHVPLDASTRHLLEERRLRSMRPDAFLVNTSRGPLVDEAALARVLEGGHLAGAGLDVFEREPEVHPGLLSLPNVVLLPHLGSATAETRAAMAELAATNLAAVLEGREPPTPVVRGR